MSIDRRELLKAGVARIGRRSRFRAPRRPKYSFDPQPGAWRSFQVVTRVEIAQADGKAQAWIPVPAVNEQEWFKSLGSEWTTNGQAALVRDAKYGAEMLQVEWTESEKSPLR